MEFQRRRSGNACTYTHPTPHATLVADHRPSLPVQSNRFLSDGARIDTHAALFPLESDAPLGIELQRGHPVSLPSLRRDREGLGGTDCGARHVIADGARLELRIDDGRAGRQPSVRRSPEDGPRGADVDALTTPGAGGQKPDLRQSSRGTEEPPGGHTFLGMLGHLIDQLADRFPQETSAVRRISADQKLGWRLTSHLNSNLSVPC